ncbi:hypothetical protein SAMN04489761_0267 [Tenacibaculum sp. MAR_2009_124]|uniref:hypothetical protein n=1 Tax=Tenacibaculum sp. MAR_2009_124 TaxID=1250059 RepID=UPI000894A22D|nr:hypothetical protein [Tenacibaculum sp. MAR_2009_124]SEB37594.1 hypothetical protein SAMN04489761_0267 [Tenacibaculum sp. MAR_2009_124]
MKYFLFFLIFHLGSAVGQNMTMEKLDAIISSESDTILKTNNTWKFTYKDRLMMCIADEKANRMRIISPIARKEQLNEELLLNSLIANFHTALDVKYAISEDILWSVFAHPLKELSEGQIRDAISQVYLANLTFGTYYSSTNLAFPSPVKRKATPIKKPLFDLRKL